MQGFNKEQRQKIIESLSGLSKKVRHKFNDEGFILSFDKNDPAQFAQFQEFGALAGGAGIELSAPSFQQDFDPVAKAASLSSLDIDKLWVPERPVVPFSEGETKLEILIKSYHPRLPETLKKVGDFRLSLEKNGETARAIGEDELKHELEKATDVSWEIVSRSAYGDDVVRANLRKPASPKVRDEQIRCVAKCLLPEKESLVSLEDGAIIEYGSRDWHWQEWIKHKRSVEDDAKLDPQTVIPKQWATDKHILKLHQNSQELKTVFSKT